MFSIRAPLVLVSVLCAPVYAATTMHFTVQEAGKAAKPQTVHIKNNEVLIRAAGGDPFLDLFYQLAKNAFTVINHQERTTMTMDEQRLSEFMQQTGGMMDMVQQQIAKQTAGMSEADKARFQAMLQNLGGGGLMAKPEPEPKRTIVRKGSAVFNGFKCERVEVRKGAKLTTDLCFGQPGDLGVAAEDYAAAKGMVDMANRFREHAAKMAQQFGGSMPDMGPDDVPGIPVAVSQDGNQMMLIKVEKRSDDIGLPSGYTPRALPSFPGMQ